jgi:large subunit ribosomal protein L21
MYAVIKTGGKQYKVAAGEKIKVEQIAADVGQEIVIDQVLAVGNGAELKVGTPLVSGATVTATVLAHGKHDKVRIFKMRRRKHYQKRQGHRQQFTELQIGAVNAGLRSTRRDHGTEKRRRLYAKRARFQAQDARREGLSAVNSSAPAPSSCASAAPSSTPAPMSAWARTTPCSRWWTATCRSPSRAH